MHEARAMTMSGDAGREASHMHSRLHTADDAWGAHAPRRRRPKHVGAVSKVALAWRRPRNALAATASGHPMQSMKVGGAQRDTTAQPASPQLLSELLICTPPRGCHGTCSAGTASCMTCCQACHDLKVEHQAGLCSRMRPDTVRRGMPGRDAMPALCRAQWQQAWSGLQRPLRLDIQRATHARPQHPHARP